MSTGKNVLLIMLDQWRAECLSALGHVNVRTPNIDRLARDGVMLTRHYAQAVPCGPSRASVYTGMYLHNHRSIANGTPLDSGFTNIAREVRKSGYEPALFGYTDTSQDPRDYHPNDVLLRNYERVLPGFDCQLLLDEQGLSWQAHLRALGYEFAANEQQKPTVFGDDARGPTFAPALYRSEHSNAAFLTDEALKYLSVREQVPWFVHLSYLSPHHPYIASAPRHASIHPDEVGDPLRCASIEKEMEQHPYLQHYLPNPCGQGVSFGTSAADNLKLTLAQIRQVRATYYAMVGEVDTQIGRLLDMLEASGQYDDTLVIVTSDHGDMLGDHWQFGKHCYFEPAFHIPLVIRDPDSAADASRGNRIDAFSESIDLMPSILQWLGQEIPDQCDGHSLLGLYRDDYEIEAWRDAVFSEFDFRDIDATTEPGRGIAGLAHDECLMIIMRDAHYKYVHFANWPPLLFDLHKDPGEFNNLAQQPEYREIALKCVSKVLAWCMKTQDQRFANIKLTANGVASYSGKKASSVGNLAASHTNMRTLD